MQRLRTPLFATACALAVLSLTTAAMAQPGGPGGGPPGGFGGGPPGGFGGFGGFGGRGGGGGSVSHLLTLTEDAAVWDDIKITDEQLGKVTRLRAAVDKQARKARENIRSQLGQTQGQGGGGVLGANGQALDADAARAARDAARQAERDARAQSDDQIKEQTENELKKILKPTQFTRVKQIDIREAGPL